MPTISWVSLLISSNLLTASFFYNFGWINGAHHTLSRIAIIIKRKD